MYCILNIANIYKNVFAILENRCVLFLNRKFLKSDGVDLNASWLLNMRVHSTYVHNTYVCHLMKKNHRTKKWNTSIIRFG